MRAPKVLVFDEATSALDSASERVVQEALDRLMASRQCTLLVIAHRLSTVRHADAIAVLEGGRVVELGAHDELVGRAGGAYRRLLGAQEALPPLADFEDEISEADILQV